MNQPFLLLLLFCSAMFFSQKKKLEGKFNKDYQIFTTKNEDSIYFVDKFKYGNGIFCNKANLTSVTNYDNNVAIESFDKCGLIDTSGNILLPRNFDKIVIVNDSIVKLRNDNKHWLYNSKRKKDISEKFSVISYFQDMKFTLTNNGNLYGIIDLNGNEILKCEYALVLPYDKDIIIAKKDNYYGCFTAQGQALLPFKYEDVSCSEHFIFAKKGGEHQIFSKAGKLITVIAAKTVQELNENTVAVGEKDRQYIYDLKNKKRTSRESYLNLNASHFDKNRGIHIHACEKDGLYKLKSGFVDYNGRIILPIAYQIGSFREGFATIGKDEKYGFIDESKKIVIPLQFDRVWNFFNGIAKVSHHGKTAFIDTKGKILFESDINPEFVRENIGFFYNGMAVKTKDGKYGYVDRSGKEIVPLIYDQAHEFSTGSALVRKNNVYYFIDIHGKRIE